MITNPKYEKATTEQTVETVKPIVETPPKKVEPAAPIVVAKKEVALKVESPKIELVVETPKISTEKVNSPKNEEIVKKMSKDELPKLDLEKINEKMVDGQATKQTD